ncbi:MAG: hypothetical protein WC707_05525 [Candidatus Babeliaceae bacterium]|jgi:hypothetical protein
MYYKKVIILLFVCTGGNILYGSGERSFFETYRYKQTILEAKINAIFSPKFIICSALGLSAIAALTFSPSADVKQYFLGGALVNTWLHYYAFPVVNYFSKYQVLYHDISQKIVDAAEATCLVPVDKALFEKMKQKACESSERLGVYREDLFTLSDAADTSAKKSNLVISMLSKKLVDKRTPVLDVIKETLYQADIKPLPDRLVYITEKDVVQFLPYLKHHEILELSQQEAQLPEPPIRTVNTLLDAFAPSPQHVEADKRSDVRRANIGDIIEAYTYYDDLLKKKYITCDNISTNNNIYRPRFFGFTHPKYNIFYKSFGPPFQFSGHYQTSEEQEIMKAYCFYNDTKYNGQSTELSHDFFSPTVDHGRNVRVLTDYYNRKKIIHEV